MCDLPPELSPLAWDERIAATLGLEFNSYSVIFTPFSDFERA
jgi:hypothetical protein